MRQLTVLLLLISLGPAWSAHAAEVAFVDDPPESAPRSAARSSALDADDVYAGDVPDFRAYDAKMSADRSRCGYGWRALRSSRIVERPVAAPIQKIRENARRAGISAQDLNRTLKTYLKNQSSIPNQRYLTIIDFTKRSDKNRLFTIDLRTGDIKGYPTTAGTNSDPNGDGYATHFDNRREGGASSLGCYMVYGTYSGGRFGKAGTLMLHGFEKSNDNACARALIMHPRWYVGHVPGRSNGCFAVKPTDKDEVFGKVQGGGLVCAYHDGKNEAATAETAPRSRARRPRYARHRQHHQARRHQRVVKTSSVPEFVDDVD